MIKLSQALLKTLAGPHRYSHTLTISLPNTPALRLTDAPHDIVLNNVTYQSGHWFKAPHIEVMSEPKIGELAIRLQANNNALNALFFNTNWLNAPVSIKRVYYNQDNQHQGTMELWRGSISGKSGTESQKEATLDLKAASIWADFAAKRGRKTNPESQHIYYPDDNGFEFSGVLINDIPWGREGKTPALGSGGGRSGRGNMKQVQK